MKISIKYTVLQRMHKWAEMTGLNNILNIHVLWLFAKCWACQRKKYTAPESNKGSAAAAYMYIFQAEQYVI